MKSAWIRRRQVTQHLDERSSRLETRCGIVAYLVGDLRGLQVQGEFGGQCAVRPDRPGDLPRRPCRPTVVEVGRRRIHLDHRATRDRQRLVPLGDMEIRADVAEGVTAGGAVRRLRVDHQLVRQAALPRGVARCEEATAVTARDHVGVLVHRAVRDLVAPARSRGRRPVRETPSRHHPALVGSPQRLHSAGQ